VNSKSISNISS